MNIYLWLYSLAGISLRDLGAVLGVWRGIVAMICRDTPNRDGARVCARRTQ